MKYISALLLLLFSGCATTKQTPWATEAYKAMNSFSKDVYRTHRLELIGIGGAMMYNIEKMNLVFDSYRNQRLNIDQARRLLITISQGFIERINSNNDIRSYLKKYPTDHHNLYLAISFCDENENEVPKEYVSYVYLSEGKIHYCFFDSEKDEFIKEKDFKESYEEALERVKTLP